jgi:hypothetical protein
LAGNNQTNRRHLHREATMTRYRSRSRRRYGTRRRYPRSGVDPLFWVAVGVAVLIVLYVLIG